MSLVDHLSELRTRLIRAIVAVAVGSAAGFYFSRDIRRLLVEALPTHQVQVLAPGDAFGITVRISVVFGLVIAMPVILYEVWAFIAPGLTAAERRAVRPWIPLAAVFFATGVGLAWFVLPFAMSFLLSFTDEYVSGDAIAAVPYFDFVTNLFLAFGLVLEFPIVLIGLSRVGIITADRLSRSRRFVALGIAVFAAAVTPGGDLVSPFVLGGTMYVLYEFTVIMVRRSGR